MNKNKVLTIEGHIEGCKNPNKLAEELETLLEDLCDRYEARLFLITARKSLEDYLMEDIDED